MIQNIDYAPTFLDVAGAEVPSEVQGTSLVPVLENPTSADWRKSIYYHYYEHGGEHQVPRHEGVRNDRYKLINFYSNDGFDLYDLKEDPAEMADVSEQGEYSDVLASMKEDLSKLRKQYDLPPLKK